MSLPFPRQSTGTTDTNCPEWNGGGTTANTALPLRATIIVRHIERSLGIMIAADTSVIEAALRAAERCLREFDDEAAKEEIREGQPSPHPIPVNEPPPARPSRRDARRYHVERARPPPDVAGSPRGLVWQQGRGVCGVSS